ncbi:MAG: hypothetical protein Q7T39_00140 [Polaromonas sp.]|nr:hypothetical protein [Polaromonas sp.]
MTFASKFPPAPLSAVAGFINGDRSTNYPKGDDYVNEGVAFISAADLVNGRVDYSRARQISSAAYERLRSGKVQPRDILFCLRGSLGKMAYVQEQESSAIASSLVIVRAKESVDSRYLYYTLSRGQHYCPLSRMKQAFPVDGHHKIPNRSQVARKLVSAG